MSRTVKLGLYIVCVLGIVIFGALTTRAYRSAGRSAEKAADRLNRAASTENTNVAVSTNLIETTNEIPATNLVDAASNAVPAAPITNAPSETKKNLKKEANDAADVPEAAGGSATGYTRMITYGLCLLLSIIGLAVLIGYDVSHFVAHRAQEAMFNHEGQPVDADYEKAEQMATNGQYLDAVRAMREYLEKNPREQYVSLRIAEIYEQNLNNPLAAALEYEEVLKQKLPPERWGWAAIHLANIYSGKLSKPDKSMELLRRIDAEYGKTAAAKKARERLLQIDPTFVPATPQEPVETAVEDTVESAPETPRPPSNLPPGFRPKG